MMHLRTCRLGDGRTTVVALHETSLLRTGWDDMLTLIRAGEEGLNRARTTVARNAASGDVVEDATLLAPLLDPPVMQFAGLNYRDHLVEAGIEEAPEAPLIFVKTANTLIGDRESIVVTPQLAGVDYEVELAVVLGRALANAAPEDALDAVFGYTAVNDVSARDLQLDHGQLSLGKNPDTFCPMGPSIVTADDVPDPMNLRLRATVNGTLMQESTTSEMLMPLAETLSYLSRYATLPAGCVVATGTPAGVGCYRNPPVWLRPGDVVEVEVEAIGTLTNPVIGPHHG